MKWLALVAVLFLAGRVEAASNERTRGSEAAKAITTITGVAISPLLGVGAVGAWDWWKCPSEKRDQLSWYAKPTFWLPALLLALAVAAKDVFGTVMPPGAKKPLDVAETIESKVSGLVATGAFAPLVASIFSHSGLRSHELNTLGFAAIDLSPLLNILTIPFAVAAFFVVWLAGHVINVLILISPFGPVDTALKSARTAMIGLLTVVHLINPWYGALLSLLVIVVAYFIAGLDISLMIFGAIFTWDFVSLRRKRFKPAANANWMFTSRKIEKTPIRSYGKLIKTADGKLTFEYKPWLVFAKKTIILPEGRYAVGRGLFYPNVLLADGEEMKALLTMPPRYKNHEQEIAQIYAIQDIRDIGILKGLKALWRWFTGRAPAEPVAVPA